MKSSVVKHIIMYVLAFVMSSLSTVSYADNAFSNLFSKPSTKFLKVTDAFQTVNQQSGVELTVDFTVTPKHYIYKDRIHVTLVNGTQLDTQFSLKSDTVNDPEFGKVPVFQKNVQLTTRLPKSVKVGDILQLRWQGCAKAGLCYPPITEKIIVKSLKKKHK